MSEGLSPEVGAQGGFFAVDARIWAKLCVPGMMNEAVAYIVQARGTGRDNRTTTWSVESIERYTGISRHRAAAAVKNLQAKGFTRLLRGGTKPKYDLVPFSELPSFTVNEFVRAHTGRSEIWDPMGDALRRIGLPL